MYSTCPSPVLRSPGYTLLEMLVVVSILGILLAWGVPGLFKYTRSIRYTSSVNAFITVLQQARSSAITRNEAIEICPVVNQSSTCESESTSNWGTGTMISSKTSGKVIKIQDSVTGAKVTLSSNYDNTFAKAGRIIFTPTGTVARRSFGSGSNTMLFTFCGTDLKRKWIRVGPGTLIKAIDEWNNDSQDCP